MPNKNGLILLTPSSVDKTGTGSTATINANGSVTFSTCVTLSLNGVFTSAYDNYMIIERNSCTSSQISMLFRLRASGTDSTATTDYNIQALIATSTTVAGGRNTADGYWIGSRIDSTYRNGSVTTIYGPYLSQPTAYRCIGVSSESGAYLRDTAGTHELSTSYDGITLYPLSGSFTGLVSVFGMRN